jgi:hypothetical protein
MYCVIFYVTVDKYFYVYEIILVLVLCFFVFPLNLNICPTNILLSAVCLTTF